MKEKSQKTKKGSSKKTVAVTIIILLILAIAIICGVVYMNTPKEKSEDVLAKYFSLLNEKNYTELYSLISSESKNKISEEDFVKRNQNIYEGIDAVNIKIEITNKEKENNTEKISYNEEMSTSAGNISFTNTVNFINWNSTRKIK